jgi:hypothetical protein
MAAFPAAPGQSSGWSEIVPVSIGILSMPTKVAGIRNSGKSSKNKAA